MLGKAARLGPAADAVQVGLEPHLYLLAGIRAFLQHSWCQAPTVSPEECLNVPAYKVALGIHTTVAAVRALIVFCICLWPQRVLSGQSAPVPADSSSGGSQHGPHTLAGAGQQQQPLALGKSSSGSKWVFSSFALVPLHI